MPIYEYRCKKCGRIYEELVFNSKDEPKVCKECGGELERLPSFGVGFVFKGSGFYITDYKRKNYSEGGNGRKEKSEQKEKSSAKKSD